MAAAASSPYQRYRPASQHRGQAFFRPRPTRRPIVAPAPPAPTERPAVAQTPGHEPVLDIQELKTYFFTYDGVVRALDGINLQAFAGETTGVVGETGCGKSVTAFSVSRLIAEPGSIISGRIFVNGANLLWGLDKEAKFRRVGRSDRVRVIRSFRRVRAANERMSAVRGKGVAMIFQEPSQAMNPVFTISDQLGEAVLLHRGVEVYEELLRADAGLVGPAAATAAPVTPGEPLEQIPEAPAPAVEPDVDGLLHIAATGRPEELRIKTAEVAAAVGLPSLDPELFYLLRNVGAQAYGRRKRVEAVLRRRHLSGLQRRYLRYQRRLAIIERAIKDVYLSEMQRERSRTGTRSRLRFRLMAERWRHFYYGLPGVTRRASAPIKREMFWRTVVMLEGVRVANPVQVARGFPHELSGGMLQRAMIAMALSAEPGLLLADEPTTALDVTIQAQILDLMHQLREKVGTAILLITHDLGVVAEVCDRVNVMYAGVVVESAPVKELFRRPLHPYTQGLLAAIPRFDQPTRDLATIPGSVPNLIRPPTGCRFYPRCPYAMPVCREVRPPPELQGEEHMVACHLYTSPEEGEPAAETSRAELPIAGAPGAAGVAAPAH